MPAKRDLREERRAAGLCLPCGLLAIAGETRCERCKTLHRAAAQRSTARKIERRMCVDCRKPALPNYTRCADHRRKQAEHSLKSRKKLGKLYQSGRCIQCGDTAIPSDADARFGRCRICYFKTRAAYHLGARTRWEELRDKLEKQGHRCPYTGEYLELGVNASIDHERPTSRFPELQHEISNIEWVSKAANTTKGNRTKAEFLEWVTIVHAYHQSK